MDTEANKTVVKQYFEMWNTGKVELAEEVLAPNWHDHAHPEVHNLDDVKQAILKTRTALPHFHIEIDTIISEGALVAVQATIQAQRVSHVIWLIRMAEGKMSEMWTGSETMRS